MANYASTDWSSPGVDPAKSQGGPFGRFQSFPRWMMYNRIGQLGAGRAIGGGPYVGSGGQQIQQGIGDLGKALSTIMQQRHKDQVGWALLKQSGVPDDQIQQYKNAGMTGDEAYQEQLSNWDAQNEQKKEDALSKERLGQAALRQAQIEMTQAETQNLQNGLPAKGSNKTPTDNTLPQTQFDDFGREWRQGSGGRWFLIPKGQTAGAGAPTLDPQVVTPDDNGLTDQAAASGQAPVSVGQPETDQSAAALQWAQANPQDPRAAKILQVLGTR